MPTNNSWNNQVLDANVVFNGGTMQIGTDVGDNAIDIGTNASAGRTITIGNTTGASGIILDAGTNEITASADILGTGISFDAGANVLNFYEEGSWIPVLSFGGGTTGITYNGQGGSYVRIGKMIFASFGFNLTSKGTDTGIAVITGLPFNATLTNRFFAPSYLLNVTFTGDYVLLGINNGPPDVRFFQITSGGATVGFTDTNFANNSSVRGTLIYEAL